MEATVHNRFFYFGKWRKDTVLICQSIFHDSSSAGVDSSVEPCRLFKGSFLTSDSVMPDLPAANMSPATLCPPSLFAHRRTVALSGFCRLLGLGE